MLVSSGFFAVAAMLVVLQFLPPIGDALAAAGAAYLAGSFVNLGMAALLVEGLAHGPGPGLAIALAYGVGYGAATARSHGQAWRFERQLRAGNAGRTVRWDRYAQDLVIHPGRDDDRRGSTLRPGVMVERFGVDRVFTQSPGDDQPVATWLGREPGPGESGDGAALPAARTPYDGGFGTGRPLKRFRDLCLFTGPGTPRAGPVTVTAGQTVETAQRWCSFVEQDLDIRSDGTAPVRLAVGHARPLPWLPWPVIGREMANPAQRPVVLRFARGRGRWRRPEADQAAVVAAALQLAPITLGDRFAARPD